MLCIAAPVFPEHARRGAINFGSMLRDGWSISDVRFESNRRVTSSLVICSRGLNKSSDTVLLVYGSATGHSMSTVVSER